MERVITTLSIFLKNILGENRMGKHIEKKSKKSLMIIVCILLVIIILGMIVTLAYYGRNNKTKEVEESVNDFFSSLKATNIEQVNTYVKYEELISSLDSMLIENREEGVSNLEKELFTLLEWKIEEINVEENNAIVSVETKNKDLKAVVIKWLQQLSILKTSGKLIDNEMALDELEKIVANENEIETVQKEIRLNHDNGTWKIELDENLRALLYPGIDDITNVLNNY